MPAGGKPVAFVVVVSPHERSATDSAAIWQPVTLMQCVSVKPWLVIPGDDEPGGCHDLTLGKIYECLGVEGRGSFLRIVDDSGEDFLYPLSHFKHI